LSATLANSNSTCHIDPEVPKITSRSGSTTSRSASPKKLVETSRPPGKR